MNKYLCIGLAVTSLLGQPLSAAPDRKDKNKGRSTSAKHAQAAAPRKHANVSQGQSAGHRGFTASTKGSTVRNTARAQQFRSESATLARRDAVRSTARTTQFRSAPTVALAGSQFRDTRVESRDRVRQYSNRSDYQYYRPPVDIYRNWDRDRTYTWNRHRYHWFGGNWVILNADIGYDYPTTYVYRDSYPVYSDSLAARVQSRLARDGYDPGPIDGVIGPQTRGAIEAFQADNGLPVTGRIDNPLISALGL